MLNKPSGFVTNLPKEGEREASELLPKHLRKKLHAIGRMDKQSDGLLLFTDDGVLAHRLTSPKFDHEKEYIVKVDKEIEEWILERYRKGIVILGEKTKPVQVEKVEDKVYRFILREGKNRQIRRMLSNYQIRTLRLQRVRIANIKLDNLREGHYRTINVFFE
ncbi:pseudouridine synthase [Candidatus Margulisiibacteriota bacterium]